MSNEKAKAPTISELEQYIQESEIVKCAVTAAVHRFYYDRCFNPYTERPFDTPETKVINRIHNYLSCKYAGWRFKIRKHLERYSGGTEDTNALHTSCKP